LKLLIIEDEPFIAMDLESVVAGLGHEVVGIADSKSMALEMAESTCCTAAFVDMRLKDGFTGVEIAEALRTRFNLPFAFITGNVEQLPTGQCGAVGVVEKPFTEAQIAGLLTALTPQT
jgi:CheY-like chemotaxis protein